MMLTPQEEIFCQEFIKLNNASEAYRIAFPQSKRWKPETVHKRACELKATGKVSGRIDELTKEVVKKAGNAIMTASEVLQFLTTIANKDDEKTNDRIKAAELLGKSHKLFTDKVEQEVVTDDLNITVNFTE